MRLILILFLTLTVGLSLPSPSLAGLFDTKIEKAKDFAKIEKTSEARKLLDEAILDDPLDADVHYEAGLVYSQLGMTSDFDLAMKNACKLKSSYCTKVAEPYYSMGRHYLNSGSQRSAIRSFEKAFAYNPAKKQGIITEIYSIGEGLLNSGNISTADSYFTALTALDPSYNDEIAEIYFRNALNAASNNAINLFRKAVYYSKGYKRQAGNKLVEMAKDDRYSEREKNAFKREAGKYLNKNEMLVYFPPDYKVFELGRQNGLRLDNMQKGDGSKYFIRSPRGFPVLQFVTSLGTGAKAVLRNGTEYDLSNDKPLPNGDYDFKIVAYEEGARVRVWFEKK